MQGVRGATQTPTQRLIPCPKDDATAAFIFLLQARLPEPELMVAREVPGSAVTNPLPGGLWWAALRRKWMAMNQCSGAENTT